MYLRVNQPFGLVYDHYLRPRTYVLGHAKIKVVLLARPTTFGCGPCIYKQINPFGVDLRTILTSTTQTLRVWVVRYVFTAWPLTGPGHSKKIHTTQLNPYGLSCVTHNSLTGIVLRDWAVATSTTCSTTQH